MKDRWIVTTYGSGTTTVSLRRAKPIREPWLYVYGPNNPERDEDRYYRDRQKVCQDVCDYLNGGSRPAWLDDLERTTEIHAESLDGTSISACGPMFDADPPHLNWRTDESDDAKNARARIMDLVFLNRERKLEYVGPE